MSDLHEALIRRIQVFGPIGDVQEVARLLAEGADVEELDKYGFTALRGAAMSGQTEFVGMLLAAGAKVDAPSERGRTALMYAASQDRAEVVRLLLDAGADAAARDADGFTAVALAARSGHGEIVRLLEAHGTDGAVASASVTADDLAAIQRWWRHQAELWWAGSPRFEAVCDYCNRHVARGDGYLIGSKLCCVLCCESKLTDEARIFLAHNPDYFGDGLLEAARRFAANGGWGGVFQAMHPELPEQATLGTAEAHRGERVSGSPNWPPRRHAALLFPVCNERERGKLLNIMSTAKQEVESLLSKLPDDCSLEDIQYHLYVIEKVRNGLEAADSQGAVSQEEAERRLGKWLSFATNATSKGRLRENSLSRSTLPRCGLIVGASGGSFLIQKRL